MNLEQLTDNLSGDSLSVLARYRGHKDSIPEALCKAIYDCIVDGLIINNQETSPLEMLAIVHECLSVHDQKKEFVQS